MSHELNDEWIPENTAKPGTQEPLVEREWSGSLQATGGIKGPIYYVRVQLADVDRTLEWREVQAETPDAAIKVAEQMEDVEVALEASVVPGGVVT